MFMDFGEIWGSINELQQCLENGILFLRAKKNYHVWHKKRVFFYNLCHMD